MKTRVLAAVIANLFAGAALAQSATEASYIELGPIGSSTSGNKAKWEEYRDMSNGVLGTLNLNRRTDDQRLNVWIENPGRDDQFLTLQGRQYGSWKYSASYNETPHVFWNDARSFYSGVGGSRLDYPNSAGYPRTPSGSVYTPDPLVSNPDAWVSTFDYKLKRKDLGGSVEYQTTMPWYFTVDANHEDRSGIKRLSSPSGVCLDRSTLCTSSFGNIVELPAPVDYRTTNASLEIGYNTKPVNFTVRYTQSRFKNDQQNLVWRNPYVTSQSFYETTTQAPDNDYKNLSIQGAARQLPWNGAVTFRTNYAKFTNSAELLSSIGVPGHLSAATGNIPYNNIQVLPPGTRFNGDIEYKSASVAWTATPTTGLDTRVYYNWIDKENNSSEIVYTAPTGDQTGTERFTYKKNDAGLDLFYRVRKDTKLKAGYEWTSLHRDRIDFDETTDQRLYAEVKYTAWDWGSVRVKYQNLDRSAHFIAGNEGTSSATDQSYMNRYIGRYDANAKDEDTWRVVLDFSPKDMLDFGVEYINKRNKYKPAYGGVILGRTKDDRDQLYLTAGYGAPNGVRLSGYVDYEMVKYDSYHRNPGMSGAAGSFDPNTPAAAASGWNWSQSERDRNWAVGAGIEWPLQTRLTLVGAIGYERTDGSMEFASQANALGVPFSLDQKIPYWDSYKRAFANFKLTWAQSAQWNWTFGYAYQKLDYQDNMFMNYRNVVSSAASREPSAYLTGYFSNPNYSANTLYVMGRYTF